jgi:protein gp37
MNNTKIEWTDWTWNPVTGCLHGCPYCYARRIANRFHGGFEPKFHPDRLRDVRQPKANDMVFVCSMADLFGGWIDGSQIRRVLDASKTRPDVIFQFLTKNPKRLAEFDFCENAWVGVTVEHEIHRARIDALMRCNARIKFVSYEPLLSAMPRDSRIDWQIIGPQTGPTRQPEKAWIVELLESGVKTFMKPALDYSPRLEEFPI